MNRPLHEIDGNRLYAIVDLADIVDEKASTIREWLRSDPSRLPLPLVFNGNLVRWPEQQLVAWCKVNCPRDFEFPATEFVSSEIAAFHNPALLAQSDPTSPISDPRATRSLLDGEPPVFYED